jgi:biotin transport system ATP-binding protein
VSKGICLTNVSVSFDGNPVLRDVTFTSNANSIAVIGSNGSGKSTFARLLNGLVKPTSGDVSVYGNTPDTKQASFLFSNPDLQIVMPTVFEDVAYTLSGLNLKPEELRTRVQKTLELVGLEDFEQSNCHELSSGQKQLLALASAEIRKPQLLIADEPTNLLDLANSRKIEKLLKRIPSEQLVLITHDLELAQTCDEAIWFEEGRLKKVGKPSELIDAYRKFSR